MRSSLDLIFTNTEQGYPFAEKTNYLIVDDFQLVAGLVGEELSCVGVESFGWTHCEQLITIDQKLLTSLNRLDQLEISRDLPAVTSRNVETVLIAADLVYRV